MPHHLIGRTYAGYQKKFYMRETMDGIQVHRTWVYAATGTGMRRMLNYLSFTATSMFGLAKAKRPDVVFVESPPLSLIVTGWLIAKRHRASLVFNVADLWPDSVRALGVMNDGWMLRAAEILEAWAYRRAHIVNAVTDGIDKVLREQKLVPPAKLRFLPNGIDVDKFVPRPPDEALRRQLNIDDRHVFIYAGTHGIGQALHRVVDAAKLVENEAIVLFVGSGPTKPYIMEHARRIGATNVRFVDPVPLESMPKYFSIAYASIVPLVSAELARGARPSKLFPAMASGVPILYSGEGEGANLVTEHGIGVVVVPENAQDMAAGMRRLMADPKTRDEMSVRARQVAVDRYAWPSIVEKWLLSLRPEVAAHA